MRSEVERRVGSGEGGSRRQRWLKGERGVSVVKVDGLLFSFSSARWRSFAVSLFPENTRITLPPLPSNNTVNPAYDHQLTAAPSTTSSYIRVEICCIFNINTEKIHKTTVKLSKSSATCEFPRRETCAKMKQKMVSSQYYVILCILYVRSIRVCIFFLFIRPIIRAIHVLPSCIKRGAAVF